MIDLAGLVATAALFVTLALLATLVALEVRRAGPDAGEPARPNLLGRTVTSRVVAVMWTMSLLLFLPRVLELLA